MLNLEDAMDALMLSGYNLRRQQHIERAWQILLLGLELVP